MSRSSLAVLLILLATVGARGQTYFALPFGEILPGSSAQVKLWWASSGWKISPDKTAPETKGRAVVIRAARNEAEAAQLVIRPAKAIPNVRIEATDLKGPKGASIGANADALRLGPRISLYDTKGNLLARLGDKPEGEAPGQFIAPHGICIDSRGDIYVGEVSWTHTGSRLNPPREIRSLQKLTRHA